jgi:tetratricopeptide (TPR) repeat protein
VLAGLTALARPAQPPEQGLNRHLVIGAVHRLLTAAAAPAGALLVVDDAHLADDATTEACVQLARTGGPRPLLVALAHRPEPVRAALAQGVAGLQRAGRAVAIDLGPMPREEIEALVAAGAPERPDDRVLTGSWRPRRATRSSPWNWFAPAVLRCAGRAPVGVGDGHRAVLDLDDATTAMLRRLAVAGADLDPGGVLALTGLAEADAFALLDAGLDAGALVVADGRYRFRHELVRRALAEEVPPHHRIAMHRDTARRLAGAGAEPALVARHWLDGDRPDEAVGWLLAAARRAARLGAFADALRHLDTLLGHDARHPDALRLRAESLDALGDGRAPAAYGLAAEVVGEPAAQEIRSQQALAQIKRGDPPGGLRTLRGLAPVTVQGRLAHALAWAGAAVLGFADPATGTAKAAESRRLALESGDVPSLVIASWAQAAAAHARGELRASLHADLLETAALPELATAVFDGHLCINQRLLYGARPYPDVIAFADAFAAEAERLGAARGRAYAVTLRGEALLLSGRLTEAEAALAEAARLSRASGGAVGESLALQRLAEAALHRGDPRGAGVLLDEALAVARESDVGFHLLDRIYGTRIAAATDPDAALAVLDDAEDSVRGPLETCPGCRITLVVPGAIAAARAGDLDRAAEYETSAQWLAEVVMRLPAWDAALQEVRGHRALAAGEPAAPHFAAAAAGFGAAGQRLDEARCSALANGPARPDDQERCRNTRLAPSGAYPFRTSRRSSDADPHPRNRPGRDQGRQRRGPPEPGRGDDRLVHPPRRGHRPRARPRRPGGRLLPLPALGLHARGPAAHAGARRRPHLRGGRGLLLGPRARTVRPHRLRLRRLLAHRGVRPGDRPPHQVLNPQARDVIGRRPSSRRPPTRACPTAPPVSHHRPPVSA